MLCKCSLPLFGHRELVSGGHVLIRLEELHNSLICLIGVMPPLWLNANQLKVLCLYYELCSNPVLTYSWKCPLWFIANSVMCKCVWYKCLLHGSGAAANPFSLSSEQKYAHVCLSQRGSKPYYTSVLWWCGLLLMGVGELGNFAAYGFAPASLIAPLGCVSVIGKPWPSSTLIFHFVKGSSKGCVSPSTIAIHHAICLVNHSNDGSVWMVTAFLFGNTTGMQQHHIRQKRPNHCLFKQQNIKLGQHCSRV